MLSPRGGVQRLAHPDRCPKLDPIIASEFLQPRVALMLGSCQADEAERNRGGVDAMADLQRRRTGVVAGPLRAHGGAVEEPTLIFFESAQSAFRAALRVRKAVADYNAGVSKVRPSCGAGVGATCTGGM